MLEKARPPFPGALNARTATDALEFVAVSPAVADKNAGGNGYETV